MDLYECFRFQFLVSDAYEHHHFCRIHGGWFMFFVTLLNQFYWFFGSTLGGVLGSFIHFNTEGLDFVLTALFVVIFLEQWLKDKDHTSSILGIVLSLLCLIAFGADDFMIPSMIAIAGVLTLLRKPLEKGGETA